MSVRTTITAPDADAPAGQTEDVIALVVAWSATEPVRIGEVAVFDGAGPWILGRGEPEGDDGGFVRFFRQRPGSMEPAGPLEGPAISRQQVRFRSRDGALVAERIGRCPMSVSGQTVDKMVVVPGDTLLLKEQLLLFCTRRPRTMPPSADFTAGSAGAFGEPDAFGILGESVVAWSLRQRIAFAARAAMHVLVVGESGTGKELAARAIHALSDRARGPFVARNAATFPATLIDAELFGNAKNYPNAGIAERPGLIGQADGGTLFLDEIAELGLEQQAHLLRVLDAGEYQRLGEASTRRSDLRLVGATNRSPDVLKHDFLARLTLRVEVPSLDVRREDIPLIVRHLLARAAARSPEAVARLRDETGRVRVDPALIAALLAHAYTTHVRELEGLLWRGMGASTGHRVALEAVFPAAASQPAATRSTPARSAPTPAVEPTAEALRASLRAHAGNLSAAARELGLPSRFALYRLLKKHGIEVADIRS